MKLETIERLMKEEAWDEALDAAALAVQHMPTCAKAHAYVGFLFYRSAQFHCAVEPLRRALILDPNLAEAAVLLVESLDRMQRYEEALSIARQALERFPNQRRLESLVRQLERVARADRVDGWERSARAGYAVVDFRED